ncbi:DUF262 domain-containing protein [Chitinophaga sp.]|uniref:DUF262 domain-containing protein n=1 Tax=Chitinophaga sp. TaxID=1869181 RepID=UPI002F920478
MKTTALKSEIRELFKKMVIRHKLRSISSILQLNNEQTHFLNYAPSYQRKYVWTKVKATYFIETILLHGEIPPIVIYIKGKIWEVIDGRQRCETIERFIKDGFSLKSRGLDRLWNLAGKKFSQLDEKMRERILDTKLRLITITDSGDANINSLGEELIKREIFKRYNLGISPLKKEEVFKAQYLQDEINLYFKNQFQRDESLYNQVMGLFEHRSKNLETMMQHIRQMLVLHNIPINRFINEQEDIVNIYYDYLSYSTITKGKREHIRLIFEKFKEKCHFLMEIKALLYKEGISSNGVIYECLYWALSICEKEKVELNAINNATFKERMVKHFAKQLQNYRIERNNHVQQILKRYGQVSSFFTSQLNISFVNYLKSDETFLSTHKKKMHKYMEERFSTGYENEYFTKTEPTTCSVNDILREMKKGKFILNPPYQRTEVMKIKKSSLLIESMLLGIKIHPLYTYRRNSGITEVVDGQQRLFTIIGFLGEQYANGNGVMTTSNKDKFSLDLRSGLSPQLHAKKFNQLSEDEQLCIKNYDLEVIEIKEENNKDFKPEELFKRLNNKPFPIKEHTFEFWNAYIDSEITNSIKNICERNSWLYLRIEDKRMLNEELVTCLGYLHYITKGAPDIEDIKEIFEIRKHPTTIILTLKNKSCITQILENPTFKAEFLLALNDFEMDFIEKVKLLISSPTGKTKEFISNRRLDSILLTGTVRVSMGFYLLWVILKGIPIEFINENRSIVQHKINRIFSMLRTSDSVERLERAIVEAWVLPISADE